MALTQISTQGIKDGTITGSDLTTNIDLVDSQKIRIGTSNDLQIFHSGNFNFIVNHNNKNLAIQAKDGENAIVTIPDAEVQLYHNNSLKFETTSTGVTVTGTINFGSGMGSGLNSNGFNINFADSNGSQDMAKFGASGDLQIYHDGSHSRIDEVGTGNLMIQSNNAVFIKKGTSENIATFNVDDAVELYYNNVKKFQTTNGGINITGSVACSGGASNNLSLPDDGKAKFGTGDDLQIYHDGTNSYVKNNTGVLYLQGDMIRFINDAGNENIIKAFGNGAVELNFDGVKKLETTSAGVSVSGASDGVLNLDTSDSRGAFVRFGQGGSFHNMVGCADGLTSGDKEDLGVRAADNIIFASGGSTERMRIDSSGNVLIGTTTKGANGADELTLGTTGDTGMTIRSGTSSAGNIFFSDGTSGGDEYRGILRYFHNTNAMVFSTDGTEKMRIDSSGRLLLGTSTQFGDGNDKLMIENGTTGGRLTFGSSAGFAEPIIGQMSAYWADNKKVAAISFFGGSDTSNKDDGTIRFATSSANNITERMRIDSSGRLGIGTTSPSVTLDIEATTPTIRLTDSDASGTPECEIKGGGGDLAFSADRDNENSNTIIQFLIDGTERMRILNNSRIGFATTSTTGLGSQTGNANVCTFNFAGVTLTQYGVTAGFYYDRLNFTNSQYFIVNSSGTGVYLGNGSTSFTAHSDERLKQNITELDGTKAYNHVKTARAASFKWKATGYPTDTKIGFIAQDWEINYPEVTNSTTEIIDEVENPKGIQYTETIPVLMAALKQAIIKIETLETEVAALKAA